jgi:DNA-binding LacI/PurR family transcriptional regulator
VLNARTDRVSQETRERVLAAVRELRYKPTALERGQKAILSQNLGVMVVDTTKNPISRHGYFREVLDGVLETAFFRGWSVTLFAEKTWGDLGLAIRRAYDGRCDGLIMIAPFKDSETVVTLQERGTPLVLVGTTPSVANVSSVDIDNVAIGVAAAKHLVELGHRRFAYVGHDFRSTSSCERWEGFRKGLKECGVNDAAISALLTREMKGDDQEEREGNLVDRIVAMGHERPTALFFWHDDMAIEFMGCLQDRGLRIPDDLSVVGVDGMPEGEACEPAITSFRQPLHSLGRRAAQMLIDRLTDEASVHPDEHVRFAIELIPRGSSGLAPLHSQFPDSTDIAVLTS